MDVKSKSPLFPGRWGVVTNDWYNMHQSFVTTAPTVLENSGDIDFFVRQTRVYARHCGDSFMVKALLKSRKLNVKTKITLAGVGLESKPCHSMTLQR